MSEKVKETAVFIGQTAVVFTFIIGIPYLISGIWPPFVSVISDSMEPKMERGDMVFIVENERYESNNSIGGIDVENEGSSAGDVIVYIPNGDSTETPVIHRAIEYVDKGEDWTDQIDSEDLSSNSCDVIANCPAPHSGFITLGDANSRVDQDARISSPVKEEWIVGKSVQTIPYLGWIRIAFSSIV